VRRSGNIERNSYAGYFAHGVASAGVEAEPKRPVRQRASRQTEHRSADDIEREMGANVLTGATDEYRDRPYEVRRPSRQNVATNGRQGRRHGCVARRKSAATLRGTADYHVVKMIGRTTAFDNMLHKFAQAPNREAVDR
jgi:hypothetical protein